MYKTRKYSNELAVLLTHIWPYGLRKLGSRVYTLYCQELLRGTSDVLDFYLLKESSLLLESPGHRYILMTPRDDLVYTVPR
jgi:hypothetical protein